jgi:TPR repeat protein
LVKASELFREAAESGDADGQHWLAVSYWNGEGVERDHKQAEKLSLAASEQNHPRAQYNLAKSYEQQGRHDESLRMYKKAATNGHADAQMRLGDRYLLGDGVPENSPEAIKWYIKAHEQGHADAAYQLGRAYRHGWGVEKNDEEAIRFSAIAVDRGRTRAKYELAQLYSVSDSAHNNVSSIMWMILAMAEKGKTKDEETRWLQINLKVVEIESPEQLEEGRRLALEWDQEHSEPSEAELKARSLHGVKI